MCLAQGPQHNDAPRPFGLESSTLPLSHCTPVMVLDGETSFLRLKEVTNTCKRMRHSPPIGGNSSVQWRKVCSSFIMS